jgi:hypothetical protein
LQESTYSPAFAADKENTMTQKQGQPSDDVSSAPESGTVCDDTSGNRPSDRGCNSGQGGGVADQSKKHSRDLTEKDDPSIASEER